VQGVVTLADGKTPVGGLTVTLAPAADEPTAFGGAQTVTDGKGRFTFKDVPEGNYRLIVVLPRLKEPLVQKLHVAGTKPVETAVRLEGVAAVTGRVVGPDGQPVADTAIPLTVWQGSTGWPQEMVTELEGEYTLILAEPGRYRWWAVVPGVGCAEASADLHRGPNLFGAAQTGADLRLQPGGRVSGKVQSEETGEPVRDARIRLQTESKHSGAWEHGRPRQVCAGLPHAAGSRPPSTLALARLLEYVADSFPGRNAAGAQFRRAPWSAGPVGHALAG
jgi:hypothetical protein